MGLFNSEQAKVVYVSFIPDDIYYASKVADFLRDEGYNVVTTPYQAMENVDATCVQITEAADVVVNITSPGAARSQRFWADMANARLSGTPVIPLVIHEFADGAPVKHYISATDSIEHGCHRLKAGLSRTKAYRDNAIAEREPAAKRMMRAAFAAVVAAVFSAITALFS